MKHADIKSFEDELLFVDLDKPSLRGLSYALRHPKMWPRGFVWNYQNCTQCAMGLAHTLWLGTRRPRGDVNVGSSIMAKTFDMPFEKAKHIFFMAMMTRIHHVSITRVAETSWFGFHKKYETINVDEPISREMVTPEMVADDIDAYLAKHGG
jgi:hypothetical protein